MITAIKQKIDTVSFSDININATLRHASTYTWLGAGVLFASYLYFVGAITFSVITERDLTHSNKVLISDTSHQELTYLNSEKDMTEEYAKTTGLVAASTLAYVAPRQAFAWNVGQ